LFQYPEFDPVAISLGPLQVRWYGLMYLAGFIVAWLGMRSRAQKPWSPIKPEQVDDIVFYAALGAIIGGRIGYMLVYGTQELLADPRSLYRVWQGGMSFHGGLAGVLIGMWIYGRYVGQRFFVLGDFIAPWAPAGLMLGRIGNFINGELWGKPTDSAWGVVYHGQARHASQLYEAFLEGLVLLVIVWGYTRKPRPTMAASGVFLLGYGVFRSIVEFVRVPDIQLGYLALGWLTMGQILSLPLIVAGLVLLWLAYRRGAVAPAPAPASPPAAAKAKRAR
jgi:phosphatidylglycerol:prolipoprotein diacylglycerol transferase